MENPDEKVIIEAFRDAKKLYLGWGGGRGLLTYLYVNNNRNISSNIIIILF